MQPDDDEQRWQRLDAAARWVERDPEAALTALGPVLAADPRDAEALALASTAHAALGDHRWALEAASALCSTRPGDALGHRLRSSALSALQRDEEAVAAAAEAVRCDPDDWESHEHFTWMALAVPRLLRAAEHASREALRLAPDEPRVHLAVAGPAVALDRVARARAAYAEALRLDPGCVEARAGLAELDGAVRPVRAARSYAAVLDVVPGLGWARSGLRACLLVIALVVHVLASAGLVAVLRASETVARGPADPAGAPALVWALAAVGVCALVVAAFAARLGERARAHAGRELADSRGLQLVAAAGLAVLLLAVLLAVQPGLLATSTVLRGVLGVQLVLGLGIWVRHLARSVTM